MAKKIILLLLTLFKTCFMTSADRVDDAFACTGRARSKSCVGIGQARSNSNRPVSPEHRGVYVRIDDRTGTAAIGINAVVPEAAVASGWRPAWVNKRNFDRCMWFSLGAVCVGTVAMTLKTCSDMQSACGSAQNELGSCSTLLSEIDRLGRLVCRLDPSLCER